MKEHYLIFKKAGKKDELIKRANNEDEAQFICQLNNMLIGKTDKLHAIIYHYKKMNCTPGFYNL